MFLRRNVVYLLSVLRPESRNRRMLHALIRRGPEKEAISRYHRKANKIVELHYVFVGLQEMIRRSAVDDVVAGIFG